MPDLSGNVNDKHVMVVSGSITSNMNVSGSVALGGGGAFYDTYDGNYTVIPKKDDISLATKKKVMKEDVTVKKVPYYEVSNEFGTTVYIGE